MKVKVTILKDLPNGLKAGEYSFPESLAKRLVAKKGIAEYSKKKTAKKAPAKKDK